MKYFSGTYQGAVVANTDILPTILEQIHDINPNFNIYSMEIFANINGQYSNLTLTEHMSANTSAKVSFNNYSTAVLICDSGVSGGYVFNYTIDNKQQITKLIFNYSGQVQINYVVSDFNQ